MEMALQSRRSEHTTKVFVGSLPPNVTAEDLRALFEPYGVIAECDIANRCGFLHLEDKDLAEKAIAELNNTTFMGARISVEMGRVKPRGERRMRGGGMGGGGGRGGGGMGRKRDMGPYARDGGGFGRGGGGGMSRNGGGGYRDDYRGYDEYREYERYDDRYDRRPPMYDDGRGGRGGGGGNGGGYMNDRNTYGNGYDRRPYEAGGGYGASNNIQPVRQYDDARMPPNGGGYDDGRRAGGSEQGQIRQPSYDRQPPAQTDMFSRRDGPPKPISTGYDRSAQGGGGQYAAYGQTNTATYANAAPQAGYGAPMNSYSQPMPTASGGGGGYGDNRGAPPPAQSYDARGQPAMANQGYASAPGGYSSQQQQQAVGGPAVGGYGDAYGMRAPSNAYDTSYPPLPQQQRGYETYPT